MLEGHIFEAHGAWKGRLVSLDRLSLASTDRYVFPLIKTGRHNFQPIKLLNCYQLLVYVNLFTIYVHVMAIHCH